MSAAACAVVLAGCSEPAATPTATPRGAGVGASFILPTTPVRIKKERFALEVALNNATRTQGLSDRGHIDASGGMLFVFPYPSQQVFLMRRCTVPLDIAFLDASGRIVSMETMAVEPPQRDDEGDWDYESRLHRYTSRYPAQFVIELAAGRLTETGILLGQKVDFDIEALKQQVQ